MKVVFSRKGFDSSYGGAPSPIVGGRPVSLPIPASRGEATTFGELGLGDLVTNATRGRITAHHSCHDDPMFTDGHCWLGQVNQAQSHLRNQGVGIGDVFLFFGLFADPETGERHHRIFGAMTVACFGSPQEIRSHDDWREPPRPHPHFFGDWEPSNTIYHGRGHLALTTHPSLRLTRPGGPLTRWTVPPWLKEHGLTYHRRAERWIGETELDAAKRGQEFVCDIGDDPRPRRWLEQIMARIAGSD